MRVLLACEESQAVCREFRKLGHDAFSADILPCSGDNPEWHIQGDVLEIIEDSWDLMIAFPPCTHLAVSGSRHFKHKIEDGRQEKGINFFMKMVNAPIEIVPKIRMVWESIMGQLAKENKKFIYGQLRQGAMTEQFVAQQIKEKHELFYWTADHATAEVDFIIQKQMQVIPIEVKAEENLKSKSLKVYTEKHKPTQAIRTSMSPYRKEDWMENIPLYAAGIVL